MQLAKCWLLIDKRGSNIPLKGVTPAELVLLVRDRQAFVGRFPIHNLEIVGESRRSDRLEKERLRNKYYRGLHGEDGRIVDEKAYKIDSLYPGEASVLPSTFEQTGFLTQAKDNNLETPVSDIPDWDESALAKLDKEFEAIDKGLPVPEIVE